MQDNFKLEDARDAIIKGIEKATSLIKPTYGPAGGNIAVEAQLPPYYIMTNDGKTIVDSVLLADFYENIGANTAKEAGNNADRDSGDGRKTTMILTEAIFKESEKIEALTMDINRSLQKCIPILFESIDKQKKEITLDDVASVARVSSESDELGNMIGEIYQKIGKDGVIEVDNSHLPETFYEITEGVRLRNATYFGQYSLTEPGKAVYKNPKVLITKDKITSIDQLDQLVGALKQEGHNELVIFFDDIDMSVASNLAFTHLQGGFKTLLIKAPTLWKDWLFEDFSKITGASIIDTKNGKTFRNLVLSDLGTCEKIICLKEETRVLGIHDISDHIKFLEDQNTDEMKLRASWLKTKVAILKVGANSESELSYRSKKAKDACNASYWALKDGVVAGGGLALLNASHDLPKDTIGGEILRKALQYPTIQNMLNAGKISDEIAILFADMNSTRGFDARTGEIVDMFEEGILDPSLVVKNAIKNSISIASTVGTSKGATILPRQISNENSRQMSAM